MKVLKREDVQTKQLPGRAIQMVVGKEEAASPSTEMTMGFARYSQESGPMEPHHHAEEIVYVLSVKDGWVRCGEQPDRVNQIIPLEAGMVLHVPALEWHAFEFEDGGHVDLLFFYGKKSLFSEGPSNGGTEGS